MTPPENGHWDDSPVEAQLAAPTVSCERHAHADSSSMSNSSPRPVSNLLQNRGAVLVMLFGVTGALALPLLWMNKRFTDGQRLFWAFVVTIYTIVLIAIVGWICLWSYRQVFGS